ncbi:2-keto-4-pentenoate hydratase [Aurantiacibacter rhizosphaerae]|uniref:2-keto-4-pentenoate hydratase n=1 Tax=Aurantiacibacter rhizosphaerae TaxID=2691582 RepID=UPI0019204019|nr:fumarylacetoacetate hydrolase family protein [Aurantiacibacter rhizosphaerae]
MQDYQSELEQALFEAGTGSQVELPQRSLDADQAYAIQRGVAARGASPVKAWKLGLTSQGSRDAFGAAEPLVGRLPAAAISTQDKTIAFAPPEMYAEAEVVFEMGEDLAPKAGAYTREDLVPAIRAIHAGIEIVRSRFVTTDLPLPLLIADNVMGHALVLGQKLTDGWDDTFADMPVSLTRNGDEVAEGATSLVMGNPLDAVVWLANWLRDKEGETLRKGQLIASGTCTGATQIYNDDVIHIDFGGATMARVSVCNDQ